MNVIINESVQNDADLKPHVIKSASQTMQEHLVMYCTVQSNLHILWYMLLIGHIF